MSDPTEGLDPTFLDLVDDGTDTIHEQLTVVFVTCHHQTDLALRILGAQANPTFASGVQGGFGSFGNQLTFPLCDQSQNPNGESIDVGTITTHEIDVAVLESEKELGVATETVKFGDDQGCFLPATLLESLSQLRTLSIGFLPTLHLHELTNYDTVLAGDVTADGFVLRFQPKTGHPLTMGGDPPI